MKNKILMLMGILILINTVYAYNLDSALVGVGYNITKVNETDKYWEFITSDGVLFVKTAHCGNLSFTFKGYAGGAIQLYVLESDKEWSDMIDYVSSGDTIENMNFTAPYGIFKLVATSFDTYINKTSTIVPLEENYTYMSFEEGEYVDLPFMNKYDNHTTDIYVYGDTGSELFYTSETKGFYQWENSKIPCEVVSSTGLAEVLIINKNKDNSSQNQYYKYYINVENFEYPVISEVVPLTNVTYTIPAGTNVSFLVILKNMTPGTVDHTSYYLNGVFIDGVSGYKAEYSYVFDKNGEYTFTIKYAFGCDRYMSVNWSIEVVGEEVCINGKVMDSYDYSDISNAYVNLYNNETGQLLETTTTDYLGEYELSCYSKNLSVKIVVSHPDYEMDEKSIKLSKYVYGEVQLQHYLTRKGYFFSIPFDFVDSDTGTDINNFSIKLEKNDYSIILDIRNLTEYQKYNCEYNITNNTIEIYNLTEGIYSIDVSAPGYEQKHYDVELHANIPFFIFYLKNISGLQRWNITGYVYDIYNNTLSDIVVELYKYPAYSSTPEIEETTVTDSGGYFEFLNISEGMKMLSITSTTYQTFSEIFNLNENKFFNITLNYTIQLIYVHGIIADCWERKEPITLADITFINKETGNNYTSISDYAGKYEIYIPPGKYGVLIEKEDYEPHSPLFTYEIDRDKEMNFCLNPSEEFYNLKIKIEHEGEGYLNPLITVYDEDKDVIAEDYCENDVFQIRLPKGVYYIDIKKEGYKVEEDLSEPINLYSHKSLTYTLISIEEEDLDDVIEDFEELMDDLHIPRNEADFLSWFRGWGYVILFIILISFFLFILLSVTSEVRKKL